MLHSINIKYIYYNSNKINSIFLEQIIIIRICIMCINNNNKIYTLNNYKIIDDVTIIKVMNSL